MRAFIYRTYIFLGALLAATLLVSIPSRAQPIIPEVEAEPTSAAVTLDGKILFRVAGLGSYSAQQRAQAITGRIETAAADLSVSAEALRVNESPDWSSISAGNRVLMAVTDADASSEGIDRKTLVEIHLFKTDALFAKPTLRVSAGGSSRLQIKFHLQPV